jgi:hypothetical protein
MKRALYLTALTAGLSLMAFADDFSGKLLDATCQGRREQIKDLVCDATSTTTSFALDVNGKIYKFDAAGNTKAAAALKNRADRSTDPAKATMASVMAKVSGTEKDGQITVDSVDVQ